MFTPPDQDDQDKEEEEDANDPDFDWIAVAKRRRVAALEDNRTLFLRLKQEGEVLSMSTLHTIYNLYYLQSTCLYSLYLGAGRAGEVLAGHQQMGQCPGSRPHR